MSGLRLVDRGNRPHIQSQAELAAYIKGRLDARAKYTEQESERRHAEMAAWRRSQIGRRRFWTRVVGVSLLIAATGTVWLLRTETQAALGLVLALSLASVATYLSWRGER